MSILPASIETYLQDAGFSLTEILVLKKLLEEDALTLRELAAKTGKSTGVLDQAVKKLLKKEILSRETINDTHKFVLKSLQTVVTWMEEDMKERQQLMVRRHQDFEIFVRSLAQTKSRPEMEYFDGIEGIKKAYGQLLNRGNDLIQYGPTLHLAEQDPLRDFRVQWFRERRNRGIFMRVITHDTSLGRRYQSRDPFEYRKTILVNEEIYPFSFEKIIAGDTIACFQLEQERAVFVRYPEYAETERVFFERLWNKKIQQVNVKEAKEEEHVSIQREIIDVPFQTKTLSLLREFFLGKKGITALMIFGFISGLLTYGIYLRDVSFNTKRVQERALSIGATGALQFDSADIEEVRTAEDINKPQYAKLIYQLNLIRSLNPGVRYAYIMRPTNDMNLLEFVADADSLNPYQRGDFNADGKLDKADELPSPGKLYNIDEVDAMKELFKNGIPTADSYPETDQWGEFLSGYGPVKDASGRTVALFGVDIEADTVKSLSRNLAVLSSIFLGLFVLFILIRIMAFNRSIISLFYKALKKLCTKRNLEYLLLGLMLIYWIIFSLYFQKQHVIQQEKGKRLMAIATTAVLQIEPKDLNNLHFAHDMKSEEYQKLFRLLNEIRRENAEVLYVYILRPTDTNGIWEFVVDADSNYYLPFNWLDYNNDDLIDDADENISPGVRYDIRFSSPQIFKLGLIKPVFEGSGLEDQWGKFITGSAPIFDENGVAVAVLAIDAQY